jgi:citrate/tricarballylate utilization protein
MHGIDGLIRSAAAEADSLQDARRQMAVCNACRYCESYCAVFPAMAMRRDFGDGDLVHLANLCHGCKGCYHACQYAPPHAFDINIPRTFAEIRQQSYAAHAWPASLGRLFERNGTIVVAATTLLVTLVLVAAVALHDPAVLFAPQRGEGAFFRIIPLSLINLLAGLSFVFALVALTMGGRSYWRGTAGGAGAVAPAAAKDAAVDVLTLRNLGGGGHGCNDIDESFSQQKRWMHQALMYGFLLCFAATTSGAAYHHLFGWRSPHAFLSLPVQLGTWGGVLICLGAAGLIRLKIVTDPAPVARNLLGGEYAILGLLFLIAATGLLLLAVRHTGAMGILFALHFGLVLSLFVAAPYSKMVHGIYRGLALLRHAQEKRTRPVAAASA